jgi:hypothetical protein
VGANPITNMNKLILKSLTSLSSNIVIQLVLREHKGRGRVHMFAIALECFCSRKSVKQNPESQSKPYRGVQVRRRQGKQQQGEPQRRPWVSVRPLH